MFQQETQCIFESFLLSNSFLFNTSLQRGVGHREVGVVWALKPGMLGVRSLSALPSLLGLSEIQLSLKETGLRSLPLQAGGRRGKCKVCLPCSWHVVGARFTAIISLSWRLPGVPSTLWEIALLWLQNTIEPVERRTGGDGHFQVLCLAQLSWDPRGFLSLPHLTPLYCPVHRPAGQNIWIRVKSFLLPWKTKKQINSVGQPAAWADECSPRRNCRWWCWRGLCVHWHCLLCPWRQSSHVAVLPWASAHRWLHPPADQVPGKMAFIAASWEWVWLGIGNALILVFKKRKGFWDTASLGSTEASFLNCICRKYYHGLVSACSQRPCSGYYERWWAEL